MENYSETIKKLEDKVNSISDSNTQSNTSGKQSVKSSGRRIDRVYKSVMSNNMLKIPIFFVAGIVFLSIALITWRPAFVLKTIHKKKKLSFKKVLITSTLVHVIIAISMYINHLRKNTT